VTTKRKPTLHLGEWIDRLGVRQREVAASAGIAEPYLTLLIRRGSERKPSAEVMIRIAEAMTEISGVAVLVDDLYGPVPSDAVLRMRSRLSRGDLLELFAVFDSYLGKRPPREIALGPTRRRKKAPKLND
jgi:hypothetical protein